MFVVNLVNRPFKLKEAQQYEMSEVKPAAAAYTQIAQTHIAPH